MASSTTKSIIYECKKYIELNELETLKLYYSELLEYEYTSQPDLPYIFHRVYLHACLKGRKDIATWLEYTIYPSMDPIQKIALRQIFPYGRHLLVKATS
jgi:hypothetical protein